MKAPPSLAGQPWLADPALARVLAALSEAGGEARIAGGAVRNAILGETIADIDIATTLTPGRVMAAGEAAGLGVKPTGLDHGTVMLIADRRPFEVTTLRVDEETFGRKARVKFTDDWLADASRRDFTMNALYCDASGTIFDPVAGYGDAVRRRVRFVGKPRRRIEEDYLRILRFFRFHARYGRGAPDAEGLRACVRMRKGLAGLSRERIRQELLKLLVAPRAAETVALMEKSRILDACLPGPFETAVLRKLQRIDAANGFEPGAIPRLHALAPYTNDLGARLRLSNEEKAGIARLRRANPPSPDLRERERRVIIYELGAGAWRDAVRLAWARSRAAAGDRRWRDLHDLALRWAAPVFPLTGKDLIAAGLSQGPEIGSALASLEDYWIAADFAPNRAELIERRRKQKEG